jgi:hypothetical protein
MSIVWIHLSSKSIDVQAGSLDDIPIVESAHPYPNNFDDSWIIECPGAEASRIHFSRIELEDDVDYLIISDASGLRTQIITGVYTDGLWTEPVPGEFVRIRLVTDRNVRKWGFAVDQKDAVEYPSIARSPHPYYNNTDESWTIYNPAPDPEATRLHFSRIELEENVDWLILTDVEGNPYQYITGSYPDGLSSIGIPGIAVQVHLITDGSVEQWGFNVDRVENTTADAPLPPPTFATIIESDHPYEDNITQEWTLTNPNPDAVSTKVHFDRIDLGGNDYVRLYDAGGTLIQVFGPNLSTTDVWSDYIPGRIVKVVFATDSGGILPAVGWGFRIDDMYPTSAEPITPASITGVYVTVVHPGTIYLDDVQVAYAQEPGEYKVLLPGEGDYVIHIEYMEYTQDIRVTVDSQGNMHILYLPLVKKQ